MGPTQVAFKEDLCTATYSAPATYTVRMRCGFRQSSTDLVEESMEIQLWPKHMQLAETEEKPTESQP